MKPKTRSPGIDVLRGLAVVLMVVANMSPALGDERPLPYRFVASLAAPLFIILAGLMVGMASERATHDLRYYLKRGGLLWLLAAFVDLAAWGNAPFITFDVLYLIGASLPLAYLLGRLPVFLAVASVLTVFAAGPISTSVFGYAEELPSSSLQAMHALGQGEVGEMAQAWLTSGWFPLLPWLGFAGLGALVGRWYGRQPRAIARPLVLMGAALAMIGGLWWAAEPGPMFVREGYAELFYPAVAGFLVCASGLCLVSLAVSFRLRFTAWLEPLQLLGEASLLAYLVHCVVLGRLVHPLLDDVSMAVLLAVSVAVVTMLCAVNAAARLVRRKWITRPLLARMLLGG